MNQSLVKFRHRINKFAATTFFAPSKFSHSMVYKNKANVIASEIRRGESLFLLIIFLMWIFVKTYKILLEQNFRNFYDLEHILRGIKYLQIIYNTLSDNQKIYMMMHNICSVYICVDMCIAIYTYFRYKYKYLLRRCVELKFRSLLPA